MAMIVKDTRKEWDARESFLKGLNEVADIVKVTLGPRGQLVLMQNPGNQYEATKDGVTVAKSIVMADPFANAAAQMVIKVASRTNQVAGDGTTTATVLAQALVKEGLSYIKSPSNPDGENPIVIKNRIEKSAKEIIEYLKSISRPVETDDDLQAIARIAANGEEEVSQIVCEAIKSVGTLGIVSVINSKLPKTTLEVVKGLTFSNGYIDERLCTNPSRSFIEYDNPYILITDKDIDAFKPIEKFFAKAIQEGRPLVLIGNKFDGETKEGVIWNVSMDPTKKIAMVEAPSYGETRNAILEDIAIFTSGRVISSNAGDQFSTADGSYLGTAKKIVIKRDSTTIIEGAGDALQIQNRCEQIKHLLSTEENEEQKRILEERLAKMSEGVAIIHVGGVTDAETKERKDRIEDAVHATRAAKEEGILPGGGSALFWAARHFYKPDNDDKNMEIIIKALMAPLLQISKNAGIDQFEVMNKLEALSSTVGDKAGYDAHKNIYGDMFELKVIDPLKVVRCALENAVSIACLLISTGGMIVDKLMFDPNVGRHVPLIND